MGRGGTWLTSRGYVPVQASKGLDQQGSTSSSLIGAASPSNAGTQGAQGTRAGSAARPGTGADPRMTFDTKAIKFYAFETSNDTDPKRVPSSDAKQQTGILDALQDRTCDQITGRRKKEETFKINNMERLVGLDSLAKVGDRVIISSRGSSVRKQGWPTIGTIIELLGRNEEAAVRWDDGTGPYKYNICSTSGYQLAFIERHHEALYAHYVRHRPSCYWTLNRSDAAARDAVWKAAEALEGMGVKGACADLKSSGGEHMPVDLPKAGVCVVCLDRGFAADSNRRGECRKELEYAVQEMGAERLVLVTLERGVGVRDLGLAAGPLGRAQCVDLSGGATEEGLRRLAGAIKKASADASVALSQSRR